MALRTIKSGSIKNYSITGDSIADGSITLDYLPNNVSYPILVSNIIYTDLNFTNTASNSTSSIGGFIKLLGSGFSPNTNVYIGDSLIPTANVLYVSNSQINLRTPNLAAGTFNLIAAKIDGTTSIRINAIRLSVPTYPAEYLVVAGGGGGGGVYGGGGGGAGGFLTGSSLVLQALSTYSITVGAGGSSQTGVPFGLNGGNGSNSVISLSGSNVIVAIGGGGGQAGSTASPTSLPPLSPGGSGGGGSWRDNTTYCNPGGSGTPGQGFPGGKGCNNACVGGGGGASEPGGGLGYGNFSYGGNGCISSISGVPTYYAGGGGGGSYYPVPVTYRIPGGLGGGGFGAIDSIGGAPTNCQATAGNVNTGGGGGGSTHNSTSTSGAGGSGIIIISYPGSQIAIGGNVTTCLGKTIHTFTSSGNLCITG
jgi:hypothetical protein